MAEYKSVFGAEVLEEVSTPAIGEDGLNSQQAFHTGSKSNQDLKTFKPKISERKRQKEYNEQQERMLAGRNAGYVLSYLTRKTHFNTDEVKSLQIMFRRFLAPGLKKLDRLRFREMVSCIFGITNNIMLDRIFDAFDGDSKGSVSETEWIIGLSGLLRGSLEQQIAYTYDVYDINQDRALGHEEVMICLRDSIHAVHGVLEHDEVEDAMKDLADMVMKRLDINRDNNVSFSEYKHILSHDPCLLELLGECLPDERAALPFMGLINAYPRSFKHYLSRPGDSSWEKERERYSHYRENGHHEGYEHSTDPGKAKASLKTDWEDHDHSSGLGVNSLHEHSLLGGNKKEGKPLIKPVAVAKKPKRVSGPPRPSMAIQEHEKGVALPLVHSMKSRRLTNELKDLHKIKNNRVVD